VRGKVPSTRNPVTTSSRFTWAECGSTCPKVGRQFSVVNASFSATIFEHFNSRMTPVRAQWTKTLFVSNDVLFPDEPAGAALSAIATAQSLVARRCSIGRGSLDANQTVVISFASAALACAVTLGCGTELPPPSTSGDTTFDGGEEQVAPNESTSTSDGGSKLAPSSAADGVSPRVCSIPTIEDEAEPRAFESLSATVIDEEGTAIPDLLAQACGMNVCLQAKTDSLGRVTISQDEEIAKLAFKYGDGLRYAQIVVAMPEGERHDLGAQATLRLPTGDPNNRLESGASLESSDARLELDPDTDIKLDRLSYPDEADYVFVAREFERDVLPSSIVGAWAAKDGILSRRQVERPQYHGAWLWVTRRLVPIGHRHRRTFCGLH
jgi:hypothetical protein